MPRRHLYRRSGAFSLLKLFCNTFETGVVTVGVVAVAGLPARSTTYDAALPAIRRARRANCVCVVIAARMLRQQYRAVAEQDTVLAKRERAARFDQTQCFGCFPRQLRLSDGGRRAPLLRARCGGGVPPGLPQLKRPPTPRRAPVPSSVFPSLPSPSPPDRAPSAECREK